MDTFYSSSFNDISLAYFTEVLSHQTLSTSLSTVEISKFKHLCFSKISLYRLEYQRVIFHNLSSFYVNNMKPENHMPSVINMLAYAVDQRFLVLNGNCWNVWLTWLRNMPDSCKEEFITLEIQSCLHKGLTSTKSDNLVNATKVSVLVILQCVIRSQKEIKLLLHCLSDVIEKLHTNPYLDSKKVLKVLELTNSLFKSTLKYNSYLVSDLIMLMVSNLMNILQYIVYITEHLHENYDYFETLEQCLCLLHHYITTSSLTEYHEIIGPALKKFFSKVYLNILANLNTVLHALEDVNDNKNYYVLLEKFFSIKLLKYFLNWNDANIENPQKLFSLLVNILNRCDRKQLNGVCKRSEVFRYVNCDLFVSNLWGSLMLLLEKHISGATNNIENKSSLLETFFSDLTIVSYEHIVEVTQFGEYFIPMFIDDENQLIQIINYMWKIVKEQSQTDHSFWNIYHCCIKCIFHEQLLCSSRGDVIDKLKEIWNYILEEGEKKIRVVNILITHCVVIWKRQDDPSASLSNYVDELVSTSTFGPLLKKCTKPMDDLIYYLHNSGKYDEIGELKSAHYTNENVRITMVNFLLNLSGDLSNFFNQLKLNLLDVALKLATSRKCYYPNTLIHRKILRTWQLFLILLSKYPSMFDYKLILPKLYLSVKTAHQTSIRYLIEWCILLIFQHNNQFVETLLDEMDKGTEKQILSITSMMSLSIHLAGLLKGNRFEIFVKQAVPKVLPWSHAQHMTSRIYAQVVLQIIWDNILRNGCQSLQDEFRFLSYCFALKVDNSAAVKNRKELMEHFFYSQFHPMQHYSLETIFHKFPAHADILSDEWITEDKFEYHGAVADGTFGLRVYDVVELVMPNKLDGNQVGKIISEIFVVYIIY